MTGRSGDTNLTETHEEMSELLDTQVNVQNESLCWGSRKLPQAYKKCVMKMKEERKRMTAGVKIFVVKGRTV